MVDIITTIHPLSKIIISMIILLAVFICVRTVTFFINKIKRFKMDMTLIYLIRDLIQYTIYVIAVLLIFDVFGIDLTAIFVSIGIVGIAIGFAAKDIISSFMSGISLISDKTVKVGDIMEIGNIKGEITKISFRTTTIKDDNGNIIIIPNSTLSNTPYLKYKEKEHYRINLSIIIPNEIDIKDFKENFLNKINTYTWILKEPKADIYSKEITADGPKLKISVWVNDFDKKNDYRFIITNEARKLIKERK